MSKTAGPCVLVIFGAAGDLTKRLLIPSLYNLYREKRLPNEFAIIGFARTEVGGEEGFRQKIRDDTKKFIGPDAQDDIVKWLGERAYYVQSDFDQPEGYQALAQKLSQINRVHNTQGNYLFYMATAPEFFFEIPKQIAAAKLANPPEGKWRRFIVEKPFGHDLASAHKLDLDLATILKEDQIYRIDHYLGKETVQNIMVLRFGNGIFEPVWNRRYIDHVQVTVGETVGVETRGGYYDTSGALRDMVPNHIIQLIALTAMEPPNSFDANAVRTEQTKAINAIRPIAMEEVEKCAVRGQYGDGTLEGQAVPGYRKEPRVAPDSRTETFVAMKLILDNWRWAGTPFYLRTGKRLPERTTEITIQFKSAPFMLFRQTGIASLGSNQMVLQLQPNEGISLKFEVKKPGPEIDLSCVEMKFAYADYFGKSSRTGYETLIYDCITGDPTLFKTAEAVEAGWRIVTPVLETWAATPPGDFPNYAAGTWGPQSATDLIERDGRHWRKA